ncbi:lytic transglycosylase domain-containing protein, partial [Fangia hongkongensis]|nr:lytic transglycosylase domain-containing protein [Fangia hongkongensis]
VTSYNAGQGNVANWLTNYPMDGDQWIETIPFGETRNYAKLVFAYMTIYESEILNNKKFRLSSVITQVSKKDKS